MLIFLVLICADILLGKPNYCRGSGRVILGNNIDVAAEIEVGEPMDVENEGSAGVVGNMSDGAIGNVSDVVTQHRLSDRLSNIFQDWDDEYDDGIEHVEHNYVNASFCPSNVNDPYSKAIDRYIVSKSRQRLSENFGNKLQSLVDNKSCFKQNI